MNKMKNRIKGSYKTKTGNIIPSKTGKTTKIDDSELLRLQPPNKDFDKFLREVRETQETKE